MPKIQPIKSRSDTFQLYETLRRNREKRTHMGLYFLEGVHPVEQAIAGGEQFVSIAYAEDKRLPSCEAAVGFIRSLGDFQIAGTSAKGTLSFHEADFTKPTVLVVGNETFGISKAWKENCDLLLRIPIYGAASSLNVGSAASICLYEMARQMNFDGHR